MITTIYSIAGIVLAFWAVMALMDVHSQYRADRPLWKRLDAQQKQEAEEQYQKELLEGDVAPHVGVMGYLGAAFVLVVLVGVLIGA